MNHVKLRVDRAARELRLWLWLLGHIIRLRFWWLGWELSHFAGWEFCGWEGGIQRDFFLGPFRFEWWSHAGNPDRWHYWEMIIDVLKKMDYDKKGGR